MVFAFFIACMIGALLYTLLNPKQSFATTQVIDESSILVHNGQQSMFTQSSNTFFEVSPKTISKSFKIFAELCINW